MSDDGPAADADERPTVTVGSEGFQPDADDRFDPDADDGTGQAATPGGNAVPAPDGEFDWRGWLLVGVLAVCFLGLPVLVTLRPLRVVGFRTTYLLLPLVPAFLLGATAVWVAIRSRQGEQ